MLFAFPRPSQPCKALAEVLAPIETDPLGISFGNRHINSPKCVMRAAHGVSIVLIELICKMPDMPQQKDPVHRTPQILHHLRRAYLQHLYERYAEVEVCCVAKPKYASKEPSHR